MLTQTTQSYRNNGRMFLLKRVRKTKEEYYKEIDKDALKHRELFVASMYNIIGINDIVIGIITDAFAKVKKSPLYRNAIKQKMNHVEKLMKSYERTINSMTAKYSENYANANDAFYTTNLADSIERLRILFKSEIDKHKVEYSNEISWLEIARIMLEYSVATRKQREKDINKATGRAEVYFHQLDLSKVFTIYKQIFPLLQLKTVINLNTPQCRAMFNRIDRKCNDVDRIQRTISEMTQEVE